MMPLLKLSEKNMVPSHFQSPFPLSDFLLNRFLCFNTSFSLTTVKVIDKRICGIVEYHHGACGFSTSDLENVSCKFWVKAAYY
jgi:hypothetical protein